MQKVLAILSFSWHFLPLPLKPACMYMCRVAVYLCIYSHTTIAKNLNNNSNSAAEFEIFAHPNQLTHNQQIVANCCACSAGNRIKAHWLSVELQQNSCNQDARRLPRQRNIVRSQREAGSWQQTTGFQTTADSVRCHKASAASALLCNGTAEKKPQPQ